MKVNLDELETAAREALSADARRYWFYETYEQGVEFERRQRAALDDFHTKATPAAVLALVQRIRELEHQFVAPLAR